MGYSTDFEGTLTFAHEATAPQLAALNAMFEEDCRDHPEWQQETGKYGQSLYYIALKLADDFSGIQWNGWEKTGDMDLLVNVVTNEMRKTWPDFTLTGELMAQGEDIEDRWRLYIDESGMAQREELALVGKLVTCPLCEGRFLLGEDT
jgi:hypothetical protein